jgi:hypothetical protein
MEFSTREKINPNRCGGLRPHEAIDRVLAGRILALAERSSCWHVDASNKAPQ